MGQLRISDAYGFYIFHVHFFENDFENLKSLGFSIFLVIICFTAIMK